MTVSAVDTLRADRAALPEIGGQLTDAQWQAGSGCPGWSVQDVVSHLGALYWLATDPAAVPDTTGMPTEQAQDVMVCRPAVDVRGRRAGRLRIGEQPRAGCAGQPGRPSRPK